MKIILAMVMSLDGKTTKWHQSKIYEWTSLEDRRYFSSLLKKHEAVILGRNTFNTGKTFIINAPVRRKIILTSKPNEYRTEEEGTQLEFTNDTPQRLVKRLSAQGVKTAVLVGGEQTNTPFLRSGLINEIWVTVEPMIFGSGRGLFSENEFFAPLKLFAIKKLNKRGTLLLKYKVLKSA